MKEKIFILANYLDVEEGIIKVIDNTRFMYESTYYAVFFNQEYKDFIYNYWEDRIGEFIADNICTHPVITSILEPSLLIEELQNLDEYYEDINGLNTVDVGGDYIILEEY
jgi:hypothetical protein